MFTLTITTRDYIPLTINGTSTDLLTAVMIMQSGLQMPQTIEVKVASGNGVALKTLRNAKRLTSTVEEAIVFLTPKGYAD